MCQQMASVPLWDGVCLTTRGHHDYFRTFHLDGRHRDRHSECRLDSPVGGTSPAPQARDSTGGLECDSAAACAASWIFGAIGRVVARALPAERRSAFPVTADATASHARIRPKQ